MAEYSPRDRRGSDRRPNNKSRDSDRNPARDKSRTGPKRTGFREDRMDRRAEEPDLPDDVDLNDLDPMILQDLRVLSKDNAEGVGKHMVMAVELMNDDVQLALRHARAAKERAGRVAVAREVNGIVAYHAEEWKEALSELRAARRIGGGPGLMAAMADCERALGRPQKAVELGRSDEARELDPEGKVELAIVVAGARLDLEQPESAVSTLSRLNPDMSGKGPTAARLAYAYANALEAAGRKDDAKEWFTHTVKIDPDGLTDATERLSALD